MKLYTDEFYEAVSQALETEREYINAKAVVSCYVPRGELWAQLAEEATELAHAALKIRRTLSDVNPTPVRPTDAYTAVIEELADVSLLASVLALNADLAEITQISKSKLLRWRDRLQEKEEQHD